MSAIPMNDMFQFIRARRAGQTPESMLRARIETHQEELAERARQVADQTLQQVARDQETSESLNTMVEQAHPAETAEAQLKKLKETSKQLQAVRHEASKDLEKVQSDLETQEKHKTAADAHFREVTEALSQQKETIPHLPFIYEAGSRASDSITQRLNPNDHTPSASVQRFLQEKASNDSLKSFMILEERFAARKAQLARINPISQQRTTPNGSSLPELSSRMQRLMLPFKPSRENGNGTHTPF